MKKKGHKFQENIAQESFIKYLERSSTGYGGVLHMTSAEPQSEARPLSPLCTDLRPQTSASLPAMG